MLLHVIPHNCSEIHRNVALPDYRPLVTQTSPGMDICQIGYDICEFDSLRGLGIDVIGRVHFDNRDRFAIWMGSIGDRTMSTNEWLLTSDFWQFLEPWHGRWYEYEIFIASCTDNIYDLENERWLLGDMIDHVGIYGSRVAEGLSAFNVGLVNYVFTMFPSSYHHEIFRNYYHGQKWCPCKRSRSEVKGQGHRGQHPT